jgi:DNA repair protein RecN (Recombination protein N)
MLTELRIENFAIIQKLELIPGNGLITFTGETGAGKSIILDALEAVMGGRADITSIRAGSDRAIVEAVFKLQEINRPLVDSILQREELDNESDYLILGREIRQEGRSSARINGRATSVALLKEIGSHLVDIHGQSDHLSLLNFRSHLHLLDRFAKIDAPLVEYQNNFHTLDDVQKELDTLRKAEQDATRQAEFLTYQIQEIEVARLDPAEKDLLVKERNRLANSENLALLAQKCISILEGGTPESPSVSEMLGQLTQALTGIGRLDPSQQDLIDQSSTISDVLSDISRRIQDYQEQLEFNPKRLEQVEERLELIHNLERKYGSSIDSILQYEKDARKKLDKIVHASERIPELESRRDELMSVMGSLASQLTSIRTIAAETLSHDVENELKDLSMEGAHFVVDISNKPDPEGLISDHGGRVAFNITGTDQVEFLIAPNPGEGLKPLVKIASGGETSRLMLALKNVLVQADPLPTLIFDEIDQGIGGRVGSVVGEKLWQLGRSHQVFCVTHLPQLAAFGDHHFKVQKAYEQGRTQTLVIELKTDDRLDELAHMMGSLNDANRIAAGVILEQANLRVREFQIIHDDLKHVES